MRTKCILILGGARSGKSSFAQDLAGTMGERVLFVATAEALDEDMQTRINRHRSERLASWRTLETPTDLAGHISDQINDAEVVLIDCLTLFVSNLLLGRGRGLGSNAPDDPADAEGRIIAEAEALMGVIADTQAAFLIVSNEVGLGLVPENRLGRLYRDLLGKVNQMVARRADEVYFMVSGIPVKLKG